MTLKELAHRVKAQLQSDPLEIAREIVQNTELKEYSIYRPTARWKEIIERLGLSALEAKTVCLTIYDTDASIFETLKTAVRNKYRVVISFQVDDMGYRQAFFAGNHAEKEPDLILLVNFYQDSRETVKSLYGSETFDTNDSVDTNVDDAGDDADVEIDLLE